MTHLLETRQLEKTFDAVVAASDINITVDIGEVIGVIGSNGAGKTTFVNMVTGYLEPSGGQILFEGRDITGLAIRRIMRSGICRSFQIPQLFLELSVIDNLIIALAVAHGEKPVMLEPARGTGIRREALQVLERFGIAETAEQTVGVLAQGVRKLVDIAMATVSQPRLLFLDEPTSGVSVDEKMQIMETLLTALKSSNTTVLFIEHDMEVVENFAPRVIAFYEGKVLADGPTGQVLSDSKVRQFVVGTEFHRQEA